MVMEDGLGMSERQSVRCWKVQGLSHEGRCRLLNGGPSWAGQPPAEHPSRLLYGGPSWAGQPPAEHPSLAAQQMKGAHGLYIWVTSSH